MLSKLCVKENIGKKQSCEDNIWVEQNDNFVIGCIADGCSTGIFSQFASRLICYLWQKYGAMGNQIHDLKVMLVIDGLKDTIDKLPITEMNLLSTFIPFYYSKNSRELRIRLFGDGVYFINGKQYNVEQDNTPDYIGYQVKNNYADHIMYLEKYPEIVYSNVDNFIICSDGIDSFSPNQFEVGTSIDEVKRLLETPTSENYLERMYNILKKKKFTNSDDVSIISYAKD